jgi:hypothetical protein
MSEDLRKLITEQTDTIGLIKCVFVNYKKLPKANFALPRTRARLADLKTLWKEARHFHGRITLGATSEDRKKLSYFLQNEFLVPRMLTTKLRTSFRKQ